MQCRTCGAPLPTGAATCPNCGAATPYNATGGSYDPTQRAGQVPPTSYGSPPPPPSMPGVDSSYPYGSSSPYNSTPYSSGTPYPTPQAPAPQQQGYPQYNSVPPVPGGYPQSPQGPRRNNTTTIIAVVSVLVVLLVVGTFLLINANKGGSGNNTSTPTTVVNGSTPTTVATQAPTTAPTTTNDQVDPTAAAILTGPQTTSSVDSETLAPTHITSNFQVGDTVYVTFNIDLSNVTPKNGVYGNVEIKFYNDGTLFETHTLDGVDTQHITSVKDGPIPAYLGWSKYPATQNGVAKLYWCDTNDCTNPKLAQTVTYSVS